MSYVPYALAAASLLAIVASRRWPERVQAVVLPLSLAVIGLCVWHVAALRQERPVFPAPAGVWTGLVELAQQAPAATPGEPGAGVPRLWRYVVASLFRVGWGFTLAALVGIPLGLLAGWSLRTFLAINPLVQALRPISPIAWIPVAILWFGVADGAAVFLIFLSSFFPIVVGTMAAVRNISLVHVRSAQNFGLQGLELFRRVVFPAALPQIITTLRLSLGVAWLVVVAAEMIAVNSGLGFLIIDARNMGMRYDLVLAGMLVIGLIGILLDALIRRLERFDEVRWGYQKR
ncbi:MAG: ABC transporter permease [Planctomycetes bacterium]|nr:ABC transporter permease [Planctomycetota bacterium]